MTQGETKRKKKREREAQRKKERVVQINLCTVCKEVVFKQFPIT